MALQTLANKMGMIISSDGGLMGSGINNVTIDAAGESQAFVGKVFLEAGTGSKTISSAGGKIRWRTGAVTFANAGTNFRIGIQDVASTGLEDGTFDVYADLVGATDTITGSADQLTAMETGTKTITHGDMIAICFEMTTRGGTDSIVQVAIVPTEGRMTGTINYPYRTADAGAGPVRGAAGMCGATIEFDDGTLGWIELFWMMPAWFAAPSTVTLNTGTNPDEVAFVFRVPFKCSIVGGYAVIGSIASTDSFEALLYSDPLGTPAVEQTATIDPNFTGSTSALGIYNFSFTGETLSPNTWYALAIRPTTANSITVGYIDMGSGNDKYMRPSPFGEDMQFGARQNQTGAFAEIQTYYFPLWGIKIDKLDDGVQVGGGSGGFFIQ